MSRPVSSSNQESPDLEKQGESPGKANIEQKKPTRSPGGPPGSLYKPKTLHFWLIMLCNYLALFLVAIDRTILTTAIPRITDEFDSLGDIGWYGSAYMLASATSQPLFGRIYKYYSMKWIFLINVVIFEVGSAVCAAAPNSNAFIAGRAIAGFSSSAIFSGCMLIVIPYVPLHKRPAFQAINGAVFGAASVFGPLVGGAFTSSVTWRWCFYINLPIGAVTLVFMAFAWHPPTQKYEPAPVLAQIKRLDPLGMFLFAPSIICLLLALQWGGSTYAWSNGRIIALFVLFGFLLLAFAASQIWNPDTAIIPARVVTHRSIASTCLFVFPLAGSMTMLLYYLPIWFQTVKLVNPVHSGIYTLPLVLSLIAATFISGFLTQKIGYYVPSMYLSPSLLAVGTGLLSTFTISTGSPHWIGYQFICGFGLGTGMQNAGLVVQRILPMSDMSIGISLMFLLQQLGGAIFTTVGETILSNLLVSRLSGVPGLDASEIVNQGATEFTSVVPAQYIVVVKQAYNYACTRIFLVAMALALAGAVSSLGLEWKSIKKGKNGQEKSVQEPPKTDASNGDRK